MPHQPMRASLPTLPFAQQQI
ncbi:DNA repair protein RadC, partial [Yersinia pseudotuberculosis]|nr:DNA repair protein RadC [Yersinia pseudotuberculosis]MBO1591928.1 DNA repair protein RadC [Yersinia pseudotuberculosis]